MPRVPRDETPLANDRVALLLLLTTFLFVGTLRQFLSAVYYHNLAALELNATALYALLLLAPALFFVPALARRPRAIFVAGAACLCIGRTLLPFARGTTLLLPLAGIASAGWLLLLGGLLPLLRRENFAYAAAGLALGWALDVALLWYGDSADPLAGTSGLLLIGPSALLALLLANASRAQAPPPTLATRTPWLAGLGLGAWLFFENVVLSNPYGTARWNGVAPDLLAGAALIGLIGGALLATLVRSWPRGVVLGLQAFVALTILDHAWLHTPLLPLLVVAAQATLVVDLALLVGRLSCDRAGRALVAGAAFTLLAHFAFAFTFLFDFVPLSSLWEGNAPALFTLALLALLAVPILRAGDAPARPARSAPRIAALVGVPALVAIAAIATPSATVVPPAQEDALSLMTFNLHQGFANDGVLDPQGLVDVLAAADANVVVLQEGDTPRFTSGNLDAAGYLAAKLGYHQAYGQPTRAQAFGGSLLSRFPIREWTTRELPSESDDRWYVEARLDVAGKDVWVYAIHLSLPHEDRIAQTRALLEQAATHAGPRVLAGDFNSCPGGLCPDYEEGVPDDVYARIGAEYEDAWTAAGNAVDDPAGYTYDATAPFMRIDHVFVSHDISVTSVERVRSSAAVRASDHLPVVAQLRLK